VQRKGLWVFNGTFNNILAKIAEGNQSTPDLP